MRPLGIPEHLRLTIATPEGLFLAVYSAKGLAQLYFPDPRTKPIPLAIIGIPPRVRSWHRATQFALRALLAGEQPRDFPPIDLSAGTPFQQAVWRALQSIPLGQTRSYGEIAAAVGRPKAVRAVGGACGANPIPVLVPCHRVLAARGKLGGFSGGLARKRHLLAREGIVPG